MDARRDFLKKSKMLMLINVLACCLFISCNKNLAPSGENNFTPLAKALMQNHSLASKMINDTSFEIVPGAEEINLYYLNAAGDPMHVYIMEIELKNEKLELEAATPFNKPAFARQTLTQMAMYNDTLYHLVVAGVNADFFDLKTGEPRGIEYKNGVAIKNIAAHGRDFFGVTSNGKLVMGDSALYVKDSARLEEALGGFPLLIDDGKIIPQKNNSFSTTRHPRTAVGIINKKRVVFIVIDGRQKKYSNGMPLAELAQLMKILKAKYAMNLDGGGSSTFISLDTLSRQLKVRNRPSDGQQRKVANGWMVVALSPSRK